ncbi:hypothetical protein IFO69_15065 [Echinicola sp. CAU 1574]|uniref:Uncharacterized protein n=1 Tax=Echinicola arenosa TaxID=2774144 RepID=A0ABR9AMQ1_9BACT|nr:hypothetical protein [Echinicola arenosa]MBD8490076.1 hypothetical protein [Echinicola arenosa]
MEALVNEPVSTYGTTQGSTLFRPSFYYGEDLATVSTVFPNTHYLPELVVKMMHKLSEVGQINENWDSYGASKPSATSMQLAKDFLLDSAHWQLPFYFLAPGVNGEILIEFNQNNKAVELYFNDDGNSELLFYTNDECSLEGDLEHHYEALIDFFNE